MNSILPNALSNRNCEATTRKTTMKSNMRRGLYFSMVLLAFGAGLYCTMSKGAQSYPVCLTDGTDGSRRCDYATMERCRVAASGGLGDREPDPFIDWVHAHDLYQASASIAAGRRKPVGNVSLLTPMIVGLNS